MHKVGNGFLGREESADRGGCCWEGCVPEMALVAVCRAVHEVMAYCLRSLMTGWACGAV
jgi:hypothetical protein